MTFPEQILFFCATYLIYIAALYAVFFLFYKEHNKKHSVRNTIFLLGTAALSWVIAHFLKDVIAHPRPDIFHPPIITPDDAYSFPSGHAAFMFALAFAMNYFSWRTGFYLVILALITGVARVLAGAHFGYDIVGGAILGYVVALACVHLYQRYFKK